MSNSDSNFPVLRFDAVTQTLQYLHGPNWVNVPSGSGIPAGADTQIQFNDSGAFGASVDLSFDGTDLFIGPVGSPSVVLSTGGASSLDSGAISTSGTGDLAVGTIVAGALSNPSIIMGSASTTRGFLPPVMTTTNKNAITAPAEGLVVYDVTLHKLSVFTGTVWQTVTSA